VTDVTAAPGFTTRDVLDLAASAETGSEHPLGAAIVARARHDELGFGKIDRFAAVVGGGVEAAVTTEDGRVRDVLVGNRRLLEARDIDIAALADGIDVGDRPWGLLTPVHWRVGADAIHLADPRALALDEPSSRALLDAVRPLFEGEGFVVTWGAPLRWYASHPSLAALATASLDRVVGRNVDRWLPAQRDARIVRRLQNEVQMMLHTHSINVAREDAGALPVNSFWLSGCGIAQAEARNGVQLDDRLRESALAEDWPAWMAAWTALDAGLAALPLTRLTLCGERSAATFTPADPSVWQRLARPFTTPRPARELLATL